MICTARSGSCRSSAIFLPGSPPSPECCEAGDDRAGSGAVRKPAMRAARDCAQQLLLPATAGSCGGTRGFEAARSDFHEHPVYGSRRLQATLLREGISIGRRRVRRLMRKLGLWAIRPKRNTSKRAPGHKVYPYLLRGKTIDRANQVWAADITYIPMRQGFL